MEYKLDKPIKYDEFKKLPQDIRKIYIERLRDNYGATLSAIAKMLGVSGTTAYNRITCDLGIVFSPGVQSTGNKARWEEFLGEVEASPVQTAEQNEPTEEILEERPNCKMQMCSASLSFAGVIDANAIANSIRLILGDQTTDAIVRVSIENPMAYSARAN